MKGAFGMLLGLWAFVVMPVHAGWFDSDHKKGSGKLETVSVEVADFSEIICSGSYEMFVTIGEEKSVKITFDDNLIEHVRAEVKGRALNLYTTESYSSRNTCRFDITVPSLEGVEMKGSGSADIRNLNGDFYEMSVDGSGEIRAEGKAKDIQVTVSGSGDIDTRDVTADNAYVTVNGSGEIAVFASKYFEGTVNGSGDIALYGNPPHTSTHVNGSGSISRRN